MVYHLRFLRWTVIIPHVFRCDEQTLSIAAYDSPNYLHGTFCGIYLRINFMNHLACLCSQ
ncbi:hypothetical protein IscW_ISCW004251 [Ixodes scapularis]|uniref:Uncharacterized protein n=1 Tax=Ixodes scapularis TaxID=6945 RepID=B7PGE0_IXOSC|nr:hypothetical protein IscW_ISCW004251 [Ixodes scapularis]|eukprot:XP_002434262.1 hypothetical protein IscW_ISCW004251 [Ixodes scapularis]